MKNKPTNNLCFDFDIDTPTDEIIASVVSGDISIESKPIPIESKPPRAVEPIIGGVEPEPEAILPEPEPTPEPDSATFESINAPGAKSLRELLNDQAIDTANELNKSNIVPSLDTIARDNLKKYTGTGGILSSQESLGQYFTPYEVCQFVSSLIETNPKPGAPVRIFDPTCGTGRFFEYEESCECTGIEIQPDAAKIAKLLYPTANIQEADIRDNTHFRDYFDYVLGNPPFGLNWNVNPKKWNLASKAGKILSQWAVLEISIKAVKTGGVVALVVPQNSFTNERAGDIRAENFWKSNCYVRAIVHLPSMAFETSGTSWPCSVLIIQKPPCTASEPFEFTIKKPGRNWRDVLADTVEEFHKSEAFTAMKASEGVLAAKRPVKAKAPTINLKYQEEKKVFVGMLEADMSLEPKEDYILIQRKGHLLQLKPIGVIAAMKFEEWKRDKSEYSKKWSRYCTINRLIIHGEVPGFTEHGLKVKMSPDLERFMKGKREFFQHESEDMNQIFTKFPAQYEAKTKLLKQYNIYDKLFPYQRHDACIHAIKNYSFIGYIQGLGKTRTGIATVLLKQTSHNLFVCYSRLEKVWKDEMILMGIPESDILIIKTVNDLSDIRKFNIVSFETLRKQDKHDPDVMCSICNSIVTGKICQGPVKRKHQYDQPDKKICGWNRYTDSACPTCGEVKNFTGRYCNVTYDKFGDKHGCGCYTGSVRHKGHDITAWKPGIYKRMAKLFSCIVVDESQASKNKNSLQGQALRCLKAKHKIILTGTLLENYVAEAYFQLHWLLGGGSARFPYPWNGGHSMFTKQFTEFEYTKSGRKRMKPSLINEKQLWKLFDGIMTRRTEKDADVAEVISLPEAHEVKIRVDPTEPEKALYKKAFDDFENWYVAQLEERAQAPSWDRGEYDKKLSAMVLVKLNYLRHISSAPFAFSDYTGNGTAKIKVIKQIITDKVKAGKKILIASTFKNLVHELEKIDDVVQFTGEMPIRDRNKIMMDFQNKETPKVLAVTTQCCNLGVTLTRATTCIVCDLLWSPKQIEQMWKRVHRVGQKEDVDIIYLLNQGFIDEDMDALITMKDAAINKAIDRVTTAVTGTYLSPMEFANKMLSRRGNQQWKKSWKES